MIHKEVSLPVDEKVTIGYMYSSLNVIKTNPNHGFTEEEVNSLLEFEAKNLEWSKKLRDSLAMNSERMQKGIESWKAFANLYLNDIKNIASLGWYISPDLVSKYSFKEIHYFTKKENLNEFEEKLISESDKHIPLILKNCSVLFPERTPIFEEILKLYQNGFHFSIVNICYSQADGMCNRIWGFGFFDKEKPTYKLKSKDKFMEIESQMSKLFASQLEISQNEITINSKDKIFNNENLKNKSFNRHLVLHGHSINYGTKINAIRAIYLLDFLYYFIKNQNQIKSYR